MKEKAPTYIIAIDYTSADLKKRQEFKIAIYRFNRATYGDTLSVL
jgi:hypothetical protein